MALKTLEGCPMASQLRAVQPKRYPSNKYVVCVSADENHATFLDLAPKFVNRFDYCVVANGREWKTDGPSGISDVHPALRHLDLETVWHRLFENLDSEIATHTEDPTPSSSSRALTVISING
jgi:hypothetical protein